MTSLDEAKKKKFIGYRLNMAKYAHPRSLSGTADRACEVCFRSKTEGGHISPFSVYNLFIVYPYFPINKLRLINLKSIFKTPKQAYIVYPSKKFQFNTSRSNIPP